MTGSINEIISSTYTGDKSPQEVVESLNKSGIEWYVTEVGYLMIKFWQISAEGYVSREHAAKIRTIQNPQEQTNELEWLSKNLERIRSNYANKWIAIDRNRIVTYASDLPSLMRQITQIDKPFITFIPEEQVVWNFSYVC